MAITYYVALPFLRTEEGTAPGEAQEMPNERAAIRRAEAMSRDQGGLITTSLGVGARYDLNDNFHLLAYLGRGVQNTGQTDQLNWYTSILFTF